MTEAMVSRFVQPTEHAPWRHLSAPFQDVVYTIDAEHPRNVIVTYRGPAGDLVASGAADERMIDFQRRKPNNATLVDQFHRQRLKNGRVEITHIVWDVYRATTLPGVSMADMHYAIRRILQSPSLIVDDPKPDYLGRRVTYGMKEAVIDAGLAVEYEGHAIGPIDSVTVIEMMNGICAVFRPQAKSICHDYLHGFFTLSHGIRARLDELELCSDINFDEHSRAKIKELADDLRERIVEIAWRAAQSSRQRSARSHLRIAWVNPLQPGATLTEKSEVSSVADILRHPHFSRAPVSNPSDRRRKGTIDLRQARTAREEHHHQIDYEIIMMLYQLTNDELVEALETIKTIKGRRDGGSPAA